MALELVLPRNFLFAASLHFLFGAFFIGFDTTFCILGNFIGGGRNFEPKKFKSTPFRQIISPSKVHFLCDLKL